MISNNTSVALGVASEALVEDATERASGFEFILTYDCMSQLSLMDCSKLFLKFSRSSTTRPIDGEQSGTGLSALDAYTHR